MTLLPCAGLVVVVEDDEDTRELLKTVLQRRGYRVAGAQDGLEALHVLRGTDAICFVLLDLFMPQMDGFAVLREIAQDPKLLALPVCVSTSAPDAVPAGVTCLPKPLDLNQLFTMIERYCATETAALPA